MRPLKRPMFRTGGPIKEGVMNGLKDGGPATYMADATMMAGGGMPNMRGRVTGPGGYAGLKDKVIKGAKITGGTIGSGISLDFLFNLLSNASSAGLFAKGGLADLPPMRGMVTRPGKYSQDKTLVDTAGNILRKSAGQTITNLKKNPIKTTVTGKFGKAAKYGGGILDNILRKLNIQTIPKRIPSSGGMGGVKLTEQQIKAGMGTKPLSFFERVNMFRQANPKTFYGTLPFGVSGAITTGAGLGPPAIDLGKRALLQVADLAVPDVIFDQDKYIAEKEANKKLLEEAKKKKERAGDNVPDAVKDPPKPSKEELDKKKLDRIYKLLGVKRAQADAASKALIDMSRYIDEGGRDVISKKNIGSTISKAISAFDKRLDKADQLKEAAGLMVAKGIANEGDIDKKYKQVMIDAKLRELNPTVLDQKALLDVKGQTLTHDRTKTIARRSFPNAIVLADASDAKDAGVGDTITAEDFVKKQIETQGGDVAGVYIVDKSIIQVDAKGNTKQLL